MPPTPDPELNAIAASLRNISEALGKIADRIERLPVTLPSTDQQPIKKLNGRFTDYGEALVEQAFAAGAGVSEVARRFDISISAASHRRAVWKKKQPA
jgi:hypothetical protein